MNNIYSAKGSSRTLVHSSHTNLKNANSRGYHCHHIKPLHMNASHIKSHRLTHFAPRNIHKAPHPVCCAWHHGTSAASCKNGAACQHKQNKAKIAKWTPFPTSVQAWSTHRTRRTLPPTSPWPSPQPQPALPSGHSRPSQHRPPAPPSSLPFEHHRHHRRHRRGSQCCRCGVRP